MATVESAPVQPPAAAPLLSEQSFLLRGVDWQTYQGVSAALAGRHVRLTYDQGNLELMTISSIHARYSRLLGRLIVILTQELGLPIASYGDMTCEREDLDRGLEPDECFYLGNEPRVRNKDAIDLTTDPPPDLAVEVDISRNSRSRLGIYAALRVPEVWRFDGQTLQVYQLGSDGQYALHDRSRHFPMLPVAELVAFLHRRTEMDENSLVRAFQAWVREQIASNWQAPS
jgi:Uma2 family endonuclease